MAIEAKFTLNDADLEHFRQIMKKAQGNIHNLDESSILANAKKLSGLFFCSLCVKKRVIT